MDINDSRSKYIHTDIRLCCDFGVKCVLVLTYNTVDTRFLMLNIVTLETLVHCTDVMDSYITLVV